MSHSADRNISPSPVHPLEISIAQIRNAMSSSEKGVAKLSANFIEVATLLDDLVDGVSDCRSGEEGAGVEQTVERIKAVMNDSLQSFQFYDRLTQRMNHVIIVLEQLMACMTMNQSVTESEIYERILSNFTLEDEKALLHAMLVEQGWVDADMLGKKDIKTDNNNNDNAVELF